MTDTFEYKGSTFTVQHEHDDSHGAPWDENDGHGVVSEWQHSYETPRGSWVLASDRRSQRFYNWYETMAIAKRDGWGLGPDDVANL